MAEKSSALPARPRETTPARSPEYARVLDRYIARLVSLRRGSDALALYDQAAPYWNRMAEVEPGKPEGYLEAATVFWDYYQFDDALRLLDLGRNKLGNPALFAYEVGAIHENQRDYEAAIDEYVRGSLAPQGDAGARRRLLRIARRAAHRDRIDQATAALVSGATPEAAALALRVGVLDVLRRHDDLAALLTRLAAQTTSLELLDQVSTLAVNHRVEDVRVKVVQKQIELTSDPVEKMRLRLALMRLYEGQNDLDSARGVIDALHAEQPKILGVIRGAVDFHWRAKNYDRGLEVLLEAAAASYPDLQTKFRFEAVRKATGIERYEFAREHLRPLLEQKPFDAQYLAAMAVTYGSEGRYDALRDFYVQKIEALLEADLPAEAKKSTDRRFTSRCHPRPHRAWRLFSRRGPIHRDHQPLPGRRAAHPGGGALRRPPRPPPAVWWTTTSARQQSRRRTSVTTACWRGCKLTSKTTTRRFARSQGQRRCVPTTPECLHPGRRSKSG